MSDPTDNSSSQAPCVDDQGCYLGMQPLGTGTVVTEPPSLDSGWRYVSGQWRFTLLLPKLIDRARAEVDNAAGAARMRYITDVPGQAATYIMKRDQAEWYSNARLTDLSPSVPIFVQAEADALEADPLYVAQMILKSAQIWERIGGAIEGVRRKGKLAIGKATTPEEVESWRVRTLNDLLNL